MENIKYIPGDLVRIRDVEYRFISYNPDGIFYDEDNFPRKGLCHLLNKFGDNKKVWADEVKPVNLEVSMLKQREFKLQECKENCNWYHNEKLEHITIAYNLKSHVFSVYYNTACILGNLEYIHQLQHLLLGLGLNSELKV